MLQCVAVFHGVLQGVAVCQCVAVSGRKVLHVAVCCSVLQCVAVFCSVLQHGGLTVHRQCLQLFREADVSGKCFASCCSMLQYVAACCSMLQWVTVRVAFMCEFTHRLRSADLFRRTCSVYVFVYVWSVF